METRIRYVAVGLFVVTLSVAMIAMLLWLGADLTTRKHQRYSVYFTESVAGLSRNANVTYRGVDIGRVAAIQLADNDPALVHVILEVEQNTPIKTDTVAKLRMQGLTGIAEIELTGGTADASLLTESPPGAPYPVIPSGASLLSQLESAMTGTLETLDRIADRLTLLLAEENIDAMSRTFANVEQITRQLAVGSGRLGELLTQTEQLLAQGTETGESLTEMLNGMDRMTRRITDASTQIGQLAADGRTTIPELNSAIREIHALADNLSRLAEELSEQPQMLLFGRPRRRGGPGE